MAESRIFTDHFAKSSTVNILIKSTAISGTKSVKRLNLIYKSHFRFKFMNPVFSRDSQNSKLSFAW